MFEKSEVVGVAGGVWSAEQDKGFFESCRSSWGGVSVFITCAVNYGEHGLIEFENATCHLF